MRLSAVLLVALLAAPCPAAACATAQEQFDRGTIYDCQGRYDRVLEECERGLALEPDDTLFWWAKGRVLKIQGRHAGAAAAYKRSARLDTSLEEARAGERDALAAAAGAAFLAGRGRGR